MSGKIFTSRKIFTTIIQYNGLTTKLANVLEKNNDRVKL